MRDIERIFDATQCPEERKLSYVVYMLTEGVEFWLIGMRQMMEERGKMSLEEFQSKVSGGVLS